MGHIAVHKNQLVRAFAAAVLFLNIINDFFKSLEAVTSLVAEDIRVDPNLVLKNNLEGIDVECLVVYNQDLLGSSCKLHVIFNRS